MVLQQQCDKICISRLSPGITVAAIRLECARHGTVISVMLDEDGTAAYVTFASPEMAGTASRRMTGRIGVLNATEPLELRVITDVPETARFASVGPSTGVFDNRADPGELPEYLRPRGERQKRHSQSHRRSCSRNHAHKTCSGSVRKRRRSRSRARWLDRSRSNSHTATGQYIRATGCTSTVRPWERKRSPSSSRSTRKGKDTDVESRQPRQVAVRSNWAQFVQNSSTYYYNIATGQTTWVRPHEFDSISSRRPDEASGMSGVARLSHPSATGMLL